MNKTNLAAIFLFFSAFWFGFLFLTGLTTSGFLLTDDHQIMVLSQVLNGGGILEASAGYIKADMQIMGRFLPLYDLHRVVQVQLFGFDFLSWILYDGVLASLASSLLATALLLAGYSLLEAAIFPLLVFLGFQAGIWWRFGTAETIGMPIAALMLLFAVLNARKANRLFDLAFIVLGVLLAFSKESFILYLPAMLFLKIWIDKSMNGLGYRKAVMKSFMPVLFLLLLFVTEIIFIKFYLGTMGMGYAGYEGLTAGPLIAALFNYAIATNAWLIPAGLVLVLAFSGRRNIRGDVFCALIFLAISVIPQAILHAKSGVSERYILPGAFGIAFVTVHMLRQLREEHAHIGPAKGWLAGLAVWTIVALFVATGIILFQSPKFSIGLDSATLERISEIRDVPYFVFAAAYLHGLAKAASGWVLLAIVIVCAVSNLAMRRTRAAGAAIRCAYITMLVWAAAFNLTISVNNGFHSSFQGWNTNEWMRSIEENTNEADLIVVVADPALNNEWALAIKRFLEVRAERKNLRVLPVLTRKSYSPFENRLIETFPAHYGENRTGESTIDGEVKAVAIFPGVEDNFLENPPDWLEAGRYKRYMNEYGFVSYYRAF